MWDKALLSAAVAVGLWVLARWVELFSTWRNARAEQRNLIRALFAEIDFNTRDLEFFLENSADIAAIEAHLRKAPDALPHITDAHHTIIYSSNTNRLHHLSNSLTARVVLFYGLLDKIKVQIDGINQPSYAKVSAEGKIAVIRRIEANARECADAGKTILEEFSETYESLSLTRHAREKVTANGA